MCNVWLCVIFICYVSLIFVLPKLPLWRNLSGYDKSWLFPKQVTQTTSQLNVMEHVSIYLNAKEGLIEHKEPQYIKSSSWNSLWPS